MNRILAGGFPMILQRQTAWARTSWFAGYVGLVVMRDVLDIARIRQRVALPKLLRQYLSVLACHAVYPSLESMHSRSPPASTSAGTRPS